MAENRLEMNFEVGEAPLILKNDENIVRIRDVIRSAIFRRRSEWAENSWNLHHGVHEILTHDLWWWEKSALKWFRKFSHVITRTTNRGEERKRCLDFSEPIENYPWIIIYPISWIFKYDPETQSSRAKNGTHWPVTDQFWRVFGFYNCHERRKHRLQRRAEDSWGDKPRKRWCKKW